MSEVQLPTPKPEQPADESTSRVEVNLMGKRYAIEIATRSFELKPDPAEVIEMPKRDI